ncbi:MAG: hypothetical protein ACU0DT_10460 [Albimonas sp.]|uniref:hypothetical protein n=1 Tax=Albimonas sp. TaxID=1872425 RepID=UPI004056CE92
MAEARVARCRVRGPQASAGRLSALAADALRTAPEPGGRLLLLRRLDLGRAAPRGPGGDPARAALARRAGEALRRAALGAVHGGAPHAGAAGAVWFRDLAEARRLLLLRRARGAPVDAWFWRLAVPGAPRGVDPARAAALALRREAQASGEAEQELARLLHAAAGQGLAPALVRLMTGGESALAPFSRLAPADGAAAEAPAAQPDLAEAQAEAARLLRAAPEAVGAPLRRLLRGEAGSPPPPLWLRRAALLAVAPGLAAAPRRLEALAEALAQPPSPAPPAARPLAARAREAREPLREPKAEAPEDPSGAAPVPAHDAPSASAEASPEAGSSGDAPESAPLPEGEIHSPCAGLLLVVTPLRKAGFSEWLAERPALAAAGFGPAFLLHLAQVQARGAADPLLDCLAAPGLAPAEPGAARAWRRGLDGWLRRRAGRRLQDLAGRGGWLIWSQGRIEARYPAAAADLALRRRGLDADPGWVPWLGRSLRYRFDDEPMA